LSINVATEEKHFFFRRKKKKKNVFSFFFFFFPFSLSFQLGDVLEFMVTVNFVSDVLNEYARSQLPTRPTAASDMAALKSLLSDYETILAQLILQDKLSRFLTSNRFRKKVELLNSTLHKETSVLFMRLRSELRTANGARNGSVGPAVARLPNGASSPPSLSQYVQNLDPEAKALWDSNFHDLPMVEWDRFIKVYRASVPAPVHESGLKYLLDNCGTNSVSLYKFSEFLRGFGPLRESARLSAELVEAPWFHGYLSSKEAAQLLHNQGPHTFLVRISKTRLGSFALAYTDVAFQPNGQHNIKHTLIEATAPHGFKIDEETGANKEENHFRSIRDVIAHYSGILHHPFAGTLAREAWFHGDMDSKEADELLAGQADGTYLFRLSSVVGHLAVSYMQGGEVKHGKVEMAKDGFVYQNENALQVYPSLQRLVEDYSTQLVTAIHSTAWPLVEIGIYGNDVQRSPIATGAAHISAANLRAQPGRSASIGAGGNGSKPTVTTNYQPVSGVVPPPAGSASPSMSPARRPTPNLAASPASNPRRNQPSPPINNTPESEYKLIQVVPPNGNYGSVPKDDVPKYGSVPNSKPPYGSVPSNLAATNSNYNSVPGQPAQPLVNSEYGSLPVGAPGAPHGNAVPGSGYARVVTTRPAGIVSEYGSLPITTGGGYGAIPQQ
jgi:hypothetical protein